MSASCEIIAMHHQYNEQTEGGIMAQQMMGVLTFNWCSFIWFGVAFPFGNDPTDYPSIFILSDVLSSELKKLHLREMYTIQLCIYPGKCMHKDIFHCSSTTLGQGQHK